MRQKVHRSVQEGNVGEAGTQRLVNVEHVHVVVPGEFVEGRGVRVGVHEAGEVGEAV